MELIAVLENPNYIINIGNVIRNVNGLGVNKLYIIDGLNRIDRDPDILKERKSLIKHSSGAVRHTNIERFDTSQECLDFLSKNNFTSIGTSPAASCAKNYHLHESNLTYPKLAIWFGDEANGLTETVLKQCQFCLRIEMTGKVESLNLATTTGIVLYEAVKQRKL
ncbi:TrmH family RNA methyltransferase [Flavobacterium sp. 3HN19-14]|uniref:TrmH family RNA methyltransferase n=1 Tax=Flavobacterium sp. 3HN19-14 TaxID=3448133 RepID=UPI003EDF0807